MAKVTADVKFTGEPAPWDGGSDANGWQVTLRYQGRRMTVPFWTGSALGEPTARDVLECLISDASSADQSFEDWAGDLGYDADSIKALKTYEAVVKNTARLIRLMGVDYPALMHGDSEDAARHFAA